MGALQKLIRPLLPGMQGRQTLCKHCRDAMSGLCRMCACHMCGGKQDHNKQLMCGRCDMAFHIYCLRPPLPAACP